MKPTALVCAAALAVTVLAAPGSAQTASRSTGASYFGEGRHSPARIQLALKNLRVCLRMDNQGVVESALGHIAHIKVSGAPVDMSFLRPDIDRLTLTGSSPSTRTRAYVTGLLLDNPDLFATPEIRNATDGEELFEILGTVLQRSLAGYSELTYTHAE